ncbi:MAG TPA: hypothetical protein VFK80_07230 [Limnochordia bacterium]|nr:hypothetical protein [Limnochordia bacterium]
MLACGLALALLGAGSAAAADEAQPVVYEIDLLDVGGGVVAETLGADLGFIWRDLTSRLVNAVVTGSGVAWTAGNVLDDLWQSATPELRNGVGTLPLTAWGEQRAAARLFGTVGFPIHFELAANPIGASHAPGEIQASGITLDITPVKTAPERGVNSVITLSVSGEGGRTARFQNVVWVGASQAQPLVWAVLDHGERAVGIGLRARVAGGDDPVGDVAGGTYADSLQRALFPLLVASHPTGSTDLTPGWRIALGGGTDGVQLGFAGRAAIKAGGGSIDLQVGPTGTLAVMGELHQPALGSLQWRAAGRIAPGATSPSLDVGLFEITQPNDHTRLYAAYSPLTLGGTQSGGGAGGGGRWLAGFESAGSAWRLAAAAESPGGYRFDLQHAVGGKWWIGVGYERSWLVPGRRVWLELAHH